MTPVTIGTRIATGCAHAANAQAAANATQSMAACVRRARERKSAATSEPRITNEYPRASALSSTGIGAHATTNAIARASRSRNAVGATSRARLHATGIANTPAMTAGARMANSLTLPVSITIAHMASVIGT